MAGNGNPAEELLKSSRMAARQRTVEENMRAPVGAQGRPIVSDKDLAQNMMNQFRAVGINVAQTGDGDLQMDLADDGGMLGDAPTRDVRDGVHTQRDFDLNNSIALEYEATRRDGTDIGQVVANLRKGAFKDVDEEYLASRINEITSAAPGRITFAMAGKILEKSKDQMKQEGSFGRFGEEVNSSFWNGLTNGLFGRAKGNLGNGQAINEDKVSRFTDEVKSGIVDVNLSTAKRRQDVITQLENSKKAVSAAQAEYDFAMDRARQGDQRMVALLPNLQRKLDRIKNTEKVTRELGTADAYAPPIEDDAAVADIQAQKLAEAARRYYGNR